eukprot:584274-Alexandrium_andersonii.AAC.1
MSINAVADREIMGAWKDSTVGSRYDLWGICCAPEPTLTATAIERGLPAQRIGLSTGYELLRRDTVGRLMELAMEQRPRRL